MLPTVLPTQPQTAEFAEQLAAAGTAFGQARVAAIYCVHGTFSGNDALGLLTELSRFAPNFSRSLSGIVKRTVDHVVGEISNYLPEYAATMQAGLSAGADRTIPVKLFHWSSQNNHVARADGAMRLLDKLAQLAVAMPTEELDAANPPRVVLWGHSHAGNVFALLTNLLGSDTKARDTFFETAQTFYQPWLRRGTDMPVWPHVRKLLEDAEHPLRKLALDIVTFGTPIRYGWDTGGYANLLHFIYHHPDQGKAEYLGPQSIKLQRLLGAIDGDFVHQIGVSGSNCMPNPCAVRTLMADWRLDKFLERNITRENYFSRLAHGTRVPDEGTTLLVDYNKIERGVHRHFAGHALYTRRKWLPFHCRQVAERFYRERVSK